jgi:hypothetical protein
LEKDEKMDLLIFQAIFYIQIFILFKIITQYYSIEFVLFFTKHIYIYGTALALLCIQLALNHYIFLSVLCLALFIHIIKSLYDGLIKTIIENHIGKAVRPSANSNTIQKLNNIRS